MEQEKLVKDFVGDFKMKQKNKKYVTVEEGIDFRTIAKIMTGRGYRMNHATARNVLINAIRNLMSYTADQIGTRISIELMDELVKDQNVHLALADVLYQAHKTHEENGEFNGN